MPDMEVITIESETFKQLQRMIERSAILTEELANKEQDRIYSLDQAAEYLGVTKQWLSYRKKAIGYYREGKIIRIRKSSIDKYLEKHTIRKP